MATAVAADTFAETAALTKRENNDEKSIPEEVEIVLEKLLTEENKKVEIINNPHEEADVEASKVLDKDDDGGILKGESEEKTSHSEDTEGTTLKERVHEEMGTLTDIVGGTSENRRENDEMQPVKPEVVLDKQAPEETNTDDIDNPREFLKNNEDGNDGTVEVEKAVELPSVAKAIEEHNSSPEPIENPINTEDEMLPIEPEVVLDKQAPEETNTVEIDNPHESLKNNEDGNDRTIEVAKAVELPSVAKAIEEPNSSTEPIEKPINTEDEILPVQPEVVLDKQAPVDTNKVEIDNPCESLKNNEDGNGGTVEVEKVVDSVAKAIEEPNSSVEPIEKAINTEDEMLPVEPEVVLDKQAPEETNTVEIDNPRESLKNNEDGNDGTVEVEKVVDSEETNLDEAVPVIQKPLADSAQVSETVLQVDINTNDNDDNHPSKILEKDMVDGGLPQENPKEKLSDMITDHEKLASMEAPRGLPTDDNVTATVCEGISEVKEQCIAEISKDDADSKNTTCENNAEISLYVVHEEIERSGLQQNTELTFRKELILDKIDDVILKGESGDEFSHSENINDGIALYEKQLHEEMDNIADIEENTSETHLHEEMGTLTDTVGGISENQREDDEMQPVEPEVVLDKQAQEETNIVEIDNHCESLKNNEDGNGGIVEVENAVELPSVAKAIEEPNSSAEPIENPITTEDEVLPVEHKVVLDIQGPKETDRVEIDNPQESLKNNEDGNDGTAEVEKAVELPSVAKAIEKPNSSVKPIEKPINTGDEIPPGQPEVVLDKQAPNETNKVEIDNPRESWKNNEDGNDGTVEVEKAVELPSVAKAIEDPNNSTEPIENPFNTEDEILSIQPEVVLDKQAPEETNMVEIDNSFESLKNNEDGNDGTVKIETIVDSVAKAIEEPNSSVEPIEKPINAEDEMLPVEPEVVLDKQASEETDTVEIVSPRESLKNNEDGNDGNFLPSVAKAIEEPNSSVETIEKSINTEDEMQPVEPEVVLDKPAPEETNMVEIDNPRESLKNNEDGNDGTVEVEKPVELPSVVKAIEEPNRSLEPIENPINTEDEMLPVEPVLVLDIQAPEETNTVEIDNLHESLKNNEDGNDGIVEVEKAIESHSVKKAIEEPNSSPGETEDKFCHSENINDGISLHEKQLHEEMATITDIEEGTSETKRENDEMQPAEPEVLLDKQAQEETNIVEIDNPCESLEKNEDGNDGAAEVEMAVELPSVAKAIEEPNSSPKPIENPTNIEDEILPVQPEVVLDKQAPEETNKVEIDNPSESLKNNEDGNDGTVEVEKVVDSVAKAIEEPNSSEVPIEKAINTEDEMHPVETEIVLDKQAPEETNTVKIDNPRESLKNNEDCNDGTVEVEKAVELHSVAKAIEEHNSSVEPIEKPINTEDEMQPVEPEVVLDKQAPEKTNKVEIDNPCESLKNNEDGNDGTVEVQKVVDSVGRTIEEPNSSEEPIEKAINTEDEKQPVETEIVLDKHAPEETNTVEIDNPRESLKHNEDCNDGTVEVEKAVELSSVAKAIEEHNSSVEPIEKPINTEDEMQPVEPEVVLDKQASEETNTVEIDIPCEYLKNNEDGNNGTVEVEEAVELPSAAKAIEEPKSSPDPIENPINTEDEMLPVEPEVVLDQHAPEETNTVEIDNPCESLKNNEDGNDGTVEVEKVVELPSAAKAIEERNSSAEPIENPINTDDEILPVQPEVVLDKQAPEETNMVEVDNPCESLKNSEDGNDGTVEVEKAIEEPNSSVEPIEEPINTEDEMLPIELEVVLDKQALEEKNTVEIDKLHEFLKKNEDSNDGTVKVEKDVDLPSAAKAIEEPNSSPGESEDKFSHSQNINDGIALHEKQLHEEMATIAEGTSETKRESDDKTLPVDAEIVFNKLVPEEKTVEFNNPHEFSKRDEGSDETVGGENVIELPSVSKAIVEEHNSSQEPIGKPSKTGDEMPEKLLSKGENGDGQDMGIILNREIPLNETQQEAEEVSNVLDKDDDKGKTAEEISVQADSTENLKDSEESGEACKEQGKPFIPEGKNMDSMVVESSDDKEDERVEKEECFPQITCNDMETESPHGVDDLLGSQLVASEITKTTLDEVAPPSEVFTADLQGEINTSDNDYSNQSKILEQDTIVDGNLSTACKAQENPEEKLSDLITEHEENLPKESEGPVYTEASRELHTDENETTTVCEVTSQMKQHGIAETVKDDADSKNSICQNGAEKNLNAAQLAQEEIEGSCLQQNTEPTTFSKELISEQSNEGILEGEGEDKASQSQITDEGITLQEKQLHEEVATIADLAEGTSETKKENDEKTLPDEHEVMLEDKLAPDESKKVEIGNPPEISKSSEEGSDGTVECEKMIELPSVAKDTIEENNRSTEPTENPSNTEDELPGKLFSEGDNREGQDTGTILNREIPPNESQPEAEGPSKALETDDDEGMTPEKTFVQADAVINCPADFTENLKEDHEKSGEVCNENDSTQCILATKTSFPNEDSNETNAQGIADKEQDKDFIPEGENMDSLVVESHDDKEDGKVEKEESLAETCKIPLMEIQSQSSDSQDAHNVIGSPLSTSPTGETSSEKVGSSDVMPESTKASSDRMEDEFVKHDEVETETIQGVNDFLGSQLVSPEIKETGLSEGTSVRETTADPAPLIEVHGTVLEDVVHMNENNEDHQYKIIEKDNIVDDSVTVQEENITRAGEEQASEEELRGLHRDENETVAVHDVISEVEQQEIVELSKDDVDSEDSLFKYESEKENLHAPCEATEKAALPQNADQTASNEELISVKDDEVLRGESEDKAAHSDNNGETNPQETNMLTVESSSEVHKLEMPLEAEKIGFVEENLVETETEEIVIKETNEENDIIKADISSEQTQIADQSVIVKSSLDYPEEVLSLDAYQEVELKPEENELERLGENESIKEEASSDDKAGAESSAAQDSEALHAIETAVAEESHDGNGKEISEMPMLQEQVKHSIAVEKQNEELQSIVDGADTEKTLEDEKLDSCTEVQEGITGEADRSKKTESSTPSVSECDQLMQQEPVLTAVQPEIQELETEKVSGASSETEMNQPKTNEMSTNTSEETSREHGHDEIQSDVITNSQVLAHFKDSDITEEECPLDLKVIKIEQDKCSASESCKAVPTEAILNISTEGCASRAEKNQCTKPELQEENAIKSLTQEPGETAMEMGKDGETEVQQKNLDFSFNIKDSTMENSSTETEQKDVQDNIDIIESAQEHVPSHPYELQNDEADPAKIQNDNSTDSEEKGSKNEATEAASNEAAGLECGEDAKTKDSEMTQPRDFPSDFTEIKNYIDDKLAQHESKVAVLDTEFPAEADPHENTEVRTSSEGNDSQEMQQNSEAATTHNDLEEMKPENAGETKDNFEGLVFQEEKRTVDTSLTQPTILQESIEQILKPKQSEDNEAENEEQIKSMQKEDENISSNNINASQLPNEEPKERRTATEAGDETSSMAGLPGASLNEREVILYKEEDEASKVETEQHEEEEEEGGEHKGEDSGPETPVIVENAGAGAGDGDVKAGKKKHHNILSGVGSKVKHSIAKVKKVITGKSSPTKQQSPK